METLKTHLIMQWIYDGKEAIPPDDAIGFVYKITHEPTQRFYIGKRQLYSTRNVKIGKRELARIKAERKKEGIPGRTPAKKRVVTESNWRDYYSSNAWIKEQVKLGRADEFKREIIQWSYSKKQLSYYEVKYQFEYNVLEVQNALNENILGKFYKKDT